MSDSTERTAELRISLHAVNDLVSHYNENCKQMGEIPNKAVLLEMEKWMRRGHISALDLSHKKLDSKSFVPIAAALAYDTSVTTLHLSQNRLEKRGCKALVGLLKTNTTITSVDLSGNNIGDEGAAIIADLLKATTTLQALNLKDNMIEDEGIEKIAEGLQGNASLRELILDDNHIGIRGGEALIDAFKSNQHLETLSLMNTGLDSLHVAILQKLARTTEGGSQRHVNTKGNATTSSHAAKNKASVHEDDTTHDALEKHVASIIDPFKKEITLLDSAEAIDDAEKLAKKLNELSSSIQQKLASLEPFTPVNRSLMAELLTWERTSPPRKTANSPITRSNGTRDSNGKPIEDERHKQQLDALRKQKLTEHQEKRKRERAQRKAIERVIQNASEKEEALRCALAEAAQLNTELRRQLIEKSKDILRLRHEIDKWKYQKVGATDLLRRQHEEELQIMRHEHKQELRIIEQRHAQQIDELQKRLRHLEKLRKDENATAKKELADLRRAYSLLEERLSAKTTEQTKLSEHYQDVEHRLHAELEDRHNSLRQLEQKLSEREAELMRQIESHVAANHELRRQQTDLQEQIDALNGRITKLQEEIKTLRVARETDAELIRQKDAENEAFAKWIESLEKGMEELRQKAKEKETEYKNRIAKLQKAVVVSAAATTTPHRDRSPARHAGKQK